MQHEFHASPLLSVSDVAVRLAISARGVYRLISAGELRALKIGGALRVQESELARYLEGCQVVATSDNVRMAVRPKRKLRCLWR